MKRKSIHIVSSAIGSIGEITRDLIQSLAIEFNVTIEGESEPHQYDILLCHFVHLPIVREEKFKQFKHKILIQPIDGTVIKKEFIDCFNEYDLIITPAQAGKNIMSENGVTTPIVVIPNYYKAEILDQIKSCNIKQIPDDKYVFYHESTFHPRKGIELLYEGYIRAFSNTPNANNVLLVVKDMPYNKLTFDRIEKLKGEMMKLQKSFSRPARIIKISQDLQWETLQQLWYRADAYVSTAKIEGFGIPLLRFAYLEKPIVTLVNHNSGYMDYLNSRNSYLIPTKQTIAIGEHMNMYTDQTKWGIPTVEDVSRAFANCFHEHYHVTHRKTNRSLLDRMEYKNVMKKYIELLKKLD